MGSSTLAVYAALALALAVASGYAQMTAQMRTDILNEHNRVRRTINAVAMSELVYDMALECAAQRFIDNLPGDWLHDDFQHNAQRDQHYATCRGSTPSPSYVGENWFSGPPSPSMDTFARGAVNAWVDFKWDGVCSERDAYAASANDPNVGTTIKIQCAGKQTGHFTQVMWANTRNVGCGYNSRWGTLCNYWVGGNSAGKYATYGTACSACPSDLSRCYNKLCAARANVIQCTKPNATGVDTSVCGTAPGSSCPLSCRRGYKGTSVVLTCQSNGTYSGQVPKCTAAARCLLPTSGGYIVPNTTYYQGDSIAVSCASGYSGTAKTATCSSTGVWTNWPTCTPIPCARPAATLYNSAACTQSSFGSKCTVACATGLAGASKLATCGLGGKWTGLPVCQSVCTIPTGAAALPYNFTGCPSRLVGGQSCQVKCASGRNLVSSSRTVTCGAVGTSAQGKLTNLPVCSCMKLALPARLAYVGTCPSVVTQGSQCTVACAPGLTGAPTALRCTAAGWNSVPSLPVCVGTCAAIPSTSIFDSNCTARSTSSTAKTCQVKCKPGYVGTAVTYTCAIQSNGKAQFTAPRSISCVRSTAG